MQCAYCRKTLTQPLGRGRRRRFCNDACKMRLARSGVALPQPTLPPLPAWHQGRFQDYAQEYAGLVDVLITDPPYGKKNLPCYDALATFAQTVLKPGGWLLALVGDVERHAVECCWNALPWWQYVHLIMYRMLGNKGEGTTRTAMGARYFNRFKKGLLFYERHGTKSERRRGTFSDVIDVPLPEKAEMDKDEFKWQQNLLGFEQIVEMFTSPADVLCDPMMGSGITLVAALHCHRPRVIGIEKDADTFAKAHGKITRAQPHAQTAAPAAAVQLPLTA